MAIVASMAKAKRLRGIPERREYGDHSQPLFMTEWMVKKGIGDAEMGRRLGESRHTIHKWRHHQTRLDPLKMARVAAALGIWPAQLWVLPDSQADRIIQAAFPEPGPWTPPKTLPKIPRPPSK